MLYISQKDHIKYLGVLLNEDSKDNDDLYRHRKYLYSRGNMLIRKFKHCSEDVKQRLFTTFCNNVYGGHLWTVYSNQVMNEGSI